LFLHFLSTSSPFKSVDGLDPIFDKTSKKKWKLLNGFLLIGTKMSCFNSVWSLKTIFNRRWAKRTNLKWSFLGSNRMNTWLSNYITVLASPCSHLLTLNSEINLNIIHLSNSISIILFYDCNYDNFSVCIKLPSLSNLTWPFGVAITILDHM
jgi:hypothetical protein